MIIHGCDAKIALQAGERGLMGGSNEPEFFMQNYYEAIKQYTLATHTKTTKPLIAKAEWFGPYLANTSIGAFVDDIIRIVVQPLNDDRAMGAAIDADSRALTAALDQKKYAQNETKADITLTNLMTGLT